MKTPHEVQQLNNSLRPLALADRLKRLTDAFPNAEFPVMFGTEDQLTIWAIAKSQSDVNIFTPLTGALLSDAQTLLNITNERYDIKIGVGQPTDGSVLFSASSQKIANAERSTPVVSWNAKRSTLQINPLADWSFQEVLHAVAEHEVPINPLYETPISEHAKTRPHFDETNQQDLKRTSQRSIASI